MSCKRSSRGSLERGSWRPDSAIGCCQSDTERTPTAVSATRLSSSSSIRRRSSRARGGASRACLLPIQNPLVGARIFHRKPEIRARARAAGAIWRDRQKLWEMHWRTAQSLGLADRVVCGRPPDAARATPE